MREDTRFYIDGQWVSPPSRKALDVIDPVPAQAPPPIRLGRLAG